MNLLTDAWIPVHAQGQHTHLHLETILTDETSWEIDLPRDDLELAAIQLLSSLVQCLLPPEDLDDWVERLKAPIPTETYRQAIKPFQEWFDLSHSQYPFMQCLATTAKNITPIQKLFVGLPEGNNHIFFNRPGEVQLACSSCVAIALFNQASNAPSFGGGFKDGLRGVPISTMIRGYNLRETLWLNVLSLQKLPLPYDPEQPDEPVWVSPIEQNSKFSAASIGWVRGLFWQPHHLRLNSPQQGACDVCQTQNTDVFSGFLKERFKFSLEGTWKHPYSPSEWKKSNDKETNYLSFRKNIPAWTHLDRFLVPHQKTNEKFGSTPALVVDQFKEGLAGERHLSLIVGGYRNKQASILQRRHTLFDLSEGWIDKGEWGLVEKFISIILGIKKLLTNYLYGVGKKVGSQGLSETAERQFYFRTEPMIHEILRSFQRDSWSETSTQFFQQLEILVNELYDATVKPFERNEKHLKIIVVTKARFQLALKRLRKEAL